MNINSAQESTHRLDFDQPELVRMLCGQFDQHLKAIEKRLGITVGSRGTSLLLRGEPYTIQLAGRALEQLYAVLRRGHSIGEDDVLRAVDMLTQNSNSSIADLFAESTQIHASSRNVVPKTLAQKNYIEAMRKTDVVFGVGPAGTGKTYLAMAIAVQELFAKRVKRIVLCRPAVEAGERLGFLPGDLAEKVNPYLRPLYDALHDMIDVEKAFKLIQRGTIEIAPLAFMRGRTLNDSFVILDEAQNTTREQMKMFLTRLGFGSKAVVTGDVTQVDLPLEQESGLIHAMDVLNDIDGIALCEFNRKDVVRHPLVQKIVEAYERSEEDDGSGRADRERRRRMAIQRAARAFDRHPDTWGRRSSEPTATPQSNTDNGPPPVPTPTVPSR